MSNNGSRGRTQLLIGMVLVGLGTLFLLGQLFRIDLWAFLWPFFIIVPGLLFFVGMLLCGRAAGPLAIPGSIVTMVGLLLLYQSVTNHWESWAYAWALIFPTAVGIGLMINGHWSGIDHLVKTGKKWMVTGVVILLVSGTIFELLFNLSGGLIGNVIWPALLIALGVYLLVSRTVRGARSGAEPRHSERPPQTVEAEFEPLGGPRRNDLGR